MGRSSIITAAKKASAAESRRRALTQAGVIVELPPRVDRVQPPKTDSTKANACGLCLRSFSTCKNPLTVGPAAGEEFLPRFGSNLLCRPCRGYTHLAQMTTAAIGARKKDHAANPEGDTVRAWLQGVNSWEDQFNANNGRVTKACREDVSMDSFMEQVAQTERAGLRLEECLGVIWQVHPINAFELLGLHTPTTKDRATYFRFAQHYQ